MNRQDRGNYVATVGNNIKVMWCVGGEFLEENFY